MTTEVTSNSNTGGTILHPDHRVNNAFGLITQFQNARATPPINLARGESATCRAPHMEAERIGASISSQNFE